MDGNSSQVCTCELACISRIMNARARHASRTPITHATTRIMTHASLQRKPHITQTMAPVPSYTQLSSLAVPHLTPVPAPRFKWYVVVNTRLYVVSVVFVFYCLANHTEPTREIQAVRRSHRLRSQSDAAAPHRPGQGFRTSWAVSPVPPTRGTGLHRLRSSGAGASSIHEPVSRTTLQPSPEGSGKRHKLECSTWPHRTRPA